MTEGKVSIIIPCYNGASTIAQAIRGVLNQTYRPIELILVNDGSTDGSESVITGMREEIEKAGIEFRYCSQHNMGLGGAIDSGLKHVTGEFLAWCDADDELKSTSVEKRVEFLKKNPDFGSVTSNAVMFQNDKQYVEIGLLTKDIKTNSDEFQFIHMLIGHSIFCSGCHLVRTSVFLDSHGGMNIYPARHGQNWQMLLPVYYTSKHGFINEPLYKYRVSDASMTAQLAEMPLNKFYARQNEYTKIVEQTLLQVPCMSEVERKKYIRIFQKHVFEKNLDVAVQRKSIFYCFKWKIKLRLICLVLNSNFAE